MKLAPIDVSHKSFKRKAFGYDADEVNEFLKMVANELEEVIRERNKLREENREKEMDLMDYKERDKVLRETIATAQKMSEKVREDSEREAKIILSDANQKADMIVRDARDSLKRVYQEITDIKRSKIQFESNLRALVQSHLSMLDSNKNSFPEMKFSNQNFVDGNSSQETETRSTSVSPLST
tara:strand:+ start:230 stop:775 length:546 start_codon:yes stop_codon:yes gene_type:complete